MEMDVEDLLEMLEEARKQVDEKYRRGPKQISMLLKMRQENPAQFSKWLDYHLLLFSCREEIEG